MKFETVFVTSENGERREAQLVLCPKCGHDMFYNFMLGKHQHLQCVACNTTYCDGSCEMSDH